MDTIIFLPGGGGSRLRLQGEEIWPPNLFELATSYGRMQKLINPGVAPFGVVDTIPPNDLLGWPVYSPILGDLYAIQAVSANVEVIPFFYDFRKSVLDSAQALIATLENCYNNGSRSIALVAHSTGNQVARAVLEDPQWQGQPWFSSLELYIGICGPHFGVPLVLEYALGLSDWLSISASDMQTFSRNHQYPGCYQLLPFQGYDTQYDTLNDVNAGAEDFYDPAVAARFGLDTTNLDAAITLQQLLDFQNKPNSVAYALVAAQGQPTDVTINYNGDTFDDITSNNAGDNTVPLWTSAPGQMQPLILAGDHFSVMSTYAFRNFLWTKLTGGPAPFFLEEIVGVALSLDRFVYQPGEKISLLLIPDQPAGGLEAQFRIEKIEERTHARSLRKSEPFAYSGPDVRLISAELAAPDEPGVYRLSLEGKTHATAPQIAPYFAVSERTGRRSRRT